MHATQIILDALALIFWLFVITAIGGALCYLGDWMAKPPKK
jgi:hypothetical protein